MAGLVGGEREAEPVRASQSPKPRDTLIWVWSAASGAGCGAVPASSTAIGGALAAASFFPVGKIPLPLRALPSGRIGGARLLFLNASGATLASAGLLVQPFTRAADTVAADQRGLGRTEIPPGPYAMADYAADALALADHVGWATFAMVGVSFGGMVAQEVAVTAPERIERLALLCTSPGGPDAASFPLDTLDDLSPEERLATGMSVLDTGSRPNGWPTTRWTR